jgi:purine nucleosidase
MSIPIILDTDIGTDVDDAFALVMAAKEPQIDLLAVTTVYGNVDLRARMAKKLLNLLGKSDIPVGAGQSQPLFDGKDSYWSGWEGKGLLEPLNENISYDSSDAIDLMCRVLTSSPEKVVLVAIGPLTNIAVLIRDHPEVLPKIREIICMAGTLQPDDEEWNVQCDPEAALQLFTSGLPIKLGTRHFVNQALFTQEHRKALLLRSDPTLDILVRLLDEFLSHKTRNFSRMYDPITVSMAFTDQFLPTKTLPIKVNYENNIVRLIKAENNSNDSCQLAVPEAVYPDAFMDYLMQVLLH